ncbi:MAG TPA: sigma 54-interacting transcriptional regulator [Polyangia bacterium]|nr:sigma 54-interacting transcriptional regulator [Polyangia bacterium]
MTASHPALTTILEVVERLQEAPYRTNAVLLGEPGTGKEGLARALHHLMGGSSNAEAPLVRLDVAGFTDEDALAALIGRDGRAGAAQRADGGTLLVEEVAGLGPRTQAALLRLLKSGHVDKTAGKPGEYHRVRVNAIAMSDGDLMGEVREGRFRHDLYWRLARLVLTLPPLRERPDDLGPSAVWMGNRILRAAGLPGELVLTTDLGRLEPEEAERAVELTDGAIRALAGHDWPGNFRELEAVLERALLLHRKGRALTADAVLRARGV